jgi:hypothetical protein
MDKREIMPSRRSQPYYGQGSKIAKAENCQEFYKVSQEGM